MLLLIFLLMLIIFTAIVISRNRFESTTNTKKTLFKIVILLAVCFIALSSIFLLGIIVSELDPSTQGFIVTVLTAINFFLIVMQIAKR
ncbi:MAG: hypothetical protein KH344_08615 [Veillonella sp.]|jgi:hypothetical protein|uniref:hypothetical protein n=1 Tax=Bacillota TaxID=1239 RepID=UPI001CB0DCFE|nr:hypothetical protein [Clostridium sp.]MBF1742173.1 hypothetical protein [Veillonella dispar]MBS6482621.1 hypothetical protein [Veillonella sp.]